jgi:hypothetical protein
VHVLGVLLERAVVTAADASNGGLADPSPLARPVDRAEDDPAMRWLLCGSSPAPVARRVIPALLVSVILAIFGTVLLVLAPSIPGPGWLRGAYVLFVVVALKLPLIAILWWLIARNPEWPGQRPRWLPPEQAEILAYLEQEARRAALLPDAVERLEYLAQEAWHVADRLDGEAKVDALTVALRLDLVTERARRERSERS